MEQFLDNLPKVLGDEGRYAVDPDVVIKNNTVEFFKKLPGFYQKILDLEDAVTATTYGTITIDWAVKKNFVSVEIGKTKIGFFSEMPDGINPQSEGFDLNDQSGLSMIISALNKLYSRDDK